jgi:thymidylate synthase (FAD)
MTKKTSRRLYTKQIKTYRPVSRGAERWLGKPIRCLDHGFVYLVDYMGDDASITQAARVSYGKGTKTVNEDRGLIRYLRRHHHTTPFEMVEFKFHAKMPIFVARQWIRHRTANVNEYSGRYSEMLNEFYLPEAGALRKQSVQNRQGRGDELSTEHQKLVLHMLKEEYEHSFATYQRFLEPDINLSRELSRIGLSVANYTQWYWKIDLHNLMHFLRLRMDPHAQYEIRVYADALARIIRDAVPLAYEAFEDYVCNGMHISGPEKELLQKHSFPMKEKIAREIVFDRLKNKRETEECIEKFKLLNLIE